MNNNLTANAISIPVSFTHNCAYLFSADILLIHFSSIMCNDDWFALVTLQRFLVKDILRQSEFPPCASIVILILKYATCSHNWVIYKIAFICVISLIHGNAVNSFQLHFLHLLLSVTFSMQPLPFKLANPDYLYQTPELHNTGIDNPVQDGIFCHFLHLADCPS